MKNTISVLGLLLICLGYSCADISKKKAKAVVQQQADGHYTQLKQNNSLQEKYWKLIMLLKEPVKTTGSREAYLIFKQQGNLLTGHDGCNALNAGYSLSGTDQISIKQVTSTEMACINQGIQQKFTSILPSAVRYVVKTDTLLLSDRKKLPFARFEAVYLR